MKVEAHYINMMASDVYSLGPKATTVRFRQLLSESIN